jgi:NO-binding membrane sensor protein with MHYT domain
MILSNRNGIWCIFGTITMEEKIVIIPLNKQTNNYFLCLSFIIATNNDFATFRLSSKTYIDREIERLWLVVTWH